MKRNPIIITSCWSVPNLNIAYIEEGIIFIELKNTSAKTITIKALKIEFETESSFKPYSVTSKNIVKIKSKNIIKIEVPFSTKLILKHQTNVYKIKITFSLENQTHSKIFSAAPSNSIVIHSRRPVTNSMFVIHKDPIDTKLGNKVDFYLQKIGFSGFLAENDLRPGLNFWKDKIYPAIDECFAMIILWTKNASKTPKNILKEVKYAKTKKKPIILLREKNVKIHKEFLKFTEYLTAASIINEKEIVKLVENIEKTYLQGGYG